MTRRPYTLFVLGLVAFAVVVVCALPLFVTAVPGGLGDHQAAATAAEVDRIQQAWRAAGVEGMARATMFADLVFIGIFASGCMIAGAHLRRTGERLLGMAAIVGGVVFMVTDYAETIAQTIQLLRFAGDDGLAGLAATVRPVKTAAFILALVGVLGALARRKFGRGGA